jgi:ferritin-like metal-binding protein YciE
MDAINDNLNDWLRDAHAMEAQAEQMLSANASRIENYPELAARVRQHLEETRSQRQRLEACMQRRGISTSTMKDLSGMFSAFMQGAGQSMASDEVVKGAMTSYAFEHFEISAYRCLTAAAETAGDTETARVCGEILREEEAMASWLADQLPSVTRTYLQRAAGSSDMAKR